ncbi:MAG: asparagine synthase C-terminal domain-containing protein [Thermoplasmata archaeon]
MGPDSATPGETAADPVRVVVDALDHAMAERLQGVDALSVAYSGGLDSSIVALLGARRATTRLHVVGFPNSHDVNAAQRGADLLGLPLSVRTLRPADLAAAQSRWADDLADAGPTARSVALGTLMALEASTEHLVGMGQGADEWFFGYAHFLRLNPDAALRRSLDDAALLVEHEWPRAQRIARAMGHEVFSPFLDPAVIASARAAGVPVHLAGGERKALLRRAARRLGLPAELCGRPKKAFQYGSGIDAALRRGGVRP